MALIQLFFSLTVLAASAISDRGVEIKTYKINSPNSYAAYRLDINNFRNVPLDKSYTLFDLLPKKDTLAPAYNVSSVMGNNHVGVWKLNEPFQVKLLPFGGVFYQLIPISDVPDYDFDSQFDNAGLVTNVTEIESPNVFTAWRVSFKNGLSKKIVQRFKIRNRLPSTASFTTKYKVMTTNDGGLFGILFTDQYFYVEVDSGKTVKYDLVSVYSDMEKTDTYHNFNVTAHLAASTPDDSYGRLSIIFNGNGKKYHTFLSPSNEDLARNTKVWHTTVVPMNVDQIESIDFTWFDGRNPNRQNDVSFNKIVIEPIYLMDKKARKDKTIAFGGSNFFLNKMYWNLNHKVDPFDDSYRP